ncbi:putative odorant-binding protein A5 [Drosophila biarmipes]|uniref:putative odorant-binding protein A5 n=1 Tax=Drosophila biarmipes TaxID=125945 RepID=UPI0007E73E6F|nr:putative odorant-binding protein A5 [Drosophila biarmipes]
MLVSCQKISPVTRLVTELKKHHVIPRLLACKPTEVIAVLYPCDIDIKPGVTIVINEVLNRPIIRYKADPERFYTLMMVDLDVPPDNNSEWLIWMVGNIPGCDVALGQTIAAYDNRRAMEGENIHRIVFLAFQQYLELDFDEVPIHEGDDVRRCSFHCHKFARKYALGNPIAANFYLVEWVFRWTPTFLNFEME